MYIYNLQQKNVPNPIPEEFCLTLNPHVRRSRRTVPVFLTRLLTGKTSLTGIMGSGESFDGARRVIFHAGANSARLWSPPRQKPKIVLKDFRHGEL
jgi:hypothetical protein